MERNVKGSTKKGLEPSFIIGTTNPQKNPADPKISRGKQLSSLLISCILVLNILFSNPKSLLSRKIWSKSASDCYHYKENLSVKRSHMNTGALKNHFKWLIKIYPHNIHIRQERDRHYPYFTSRQAKAQKVKWFTWFQKKISYNLLILLVLEKLQKPSFLSVFGREESEVIVKTLAEERMRG